MDFDLRNYKSDGLSQKARVMTRKYREYACFWKANVIGEIGKRRICVELIYDEKDLEIVEQEIKKYPNVEIKFISKEERCCGYLIED